LQTCQVFIGDVMPLVVFIMIDGLRPEAVRPEYCSHLVNVRKRGASTLRASSVVPSITLPCHMSIFHNPLRLLMRHITPAGYPIIFATSPTMRISGMYNNTFNLSRRESSFNLDPMRRRGKRI
jgi:hypothetical protein